MCLLLCEWDIDIHYFRYFLAGVFLFSSKYLFVRHIIPIL